jgi:hypothetical protein
MKEADDDAIAHLRPWPLFSTFGSKLITLLTVANWMPLDP